VFQTLTMVLLTLFLILPSYVFAQQDEVIIDKSRIPLEARGINKFVPPGWVIEEKVSGDLNNDSLPDYALKLVEDKPADENGMPDARQRALVILLRNKEGRLHRAAVADKLLQCTNCGGAYYGAIEAPANVKIRKGILIVDQDHGSRSITSITYRFRYEPDVGKFALIGFDFMIIERLSSEDISESTNYLSGVRITRHRDGKRSTVSKKNVSKKRIYIEQVDNEKYEEAAAERVVRKMSSY
jgi:hypothetical protein